MRSDRLADTLAYGAFLRSPPWQAVCWSCTSPTGRMCHFSFPPDPGHDLPLRANRGPQCPDEDRKPSHHIRSIADQSRQPQDNRAGRVFRKDTLRRETSALVVGQPDAQPVRRRIRIAPELQRVKRSNGNPWRLVLVAVALSAIVVTLWSA